MKGEIYVENMDKHWKEVMDLAEEYGFIIQAYGGVVFLQRMKYKKKSLVKENTKIQKKI